MTTDTALAAADQLEIYTVIARICRALDQSKPEEFVTLWTPDGTYRMATSEAEGRQQVFIHQGTEELLGFARAMAERRKGLPATALRGAVCSSFNASCLMPAGLRQPQRH